MCWLVRLKHRFVLQECGNNVQYILYLTFHSHAHCLKVGSRQYGLGGHHCLQSPTTRTHEDTHSLTHPPPLSLSLLFLLSFPIFITPSFLSFLLSIHSFPLCYSLSFILFHLFSFVVPHSVTHFSLPPSCLNSLQLLLSFSVTHSSPFLPPF